MGEAPERVWIDTTSNGDCWFTAEEDVGPLDVEYVPADIANRLTARVAEMEEALRLIAAKKHPEQAEHPYQAIARAALKGE